MDQIVLFVQLIDKSGHLKRYLLILQPVDFIIKISSKMNVVCSFSRPYNHQDFYL